MEEWTCGSLDEKPHHYHVYVSFVAESANDDGTYVLIIDSESNVTERVLP